MTDRSDHQKSCYLIGRLTQTRREPPAFLSDNEGLQ